jgi:hypothetical protein
LRDGPSDSDDDVPQPRSAKKPKLVVEPVADFAKYTDRMPLKAFLELRSTFAGQYGNAVAVHGISKVFFSKVDKDYAKIQGSDDAASLGFEAARATLAAIHDTCKDHAAKMVGWKQKQDPVLLQATALDDLEALGLAKIEFEETKASLWSLKKEFSMTLNKKLRAEYNKIASLGVKFTDAGVPDGFARVLSADLFKLLTPQDSIRRFTLLR